MTVAFFASAFHPHVGGVEECCRQLAHEYRARGVEVIVLTNRWPRSLPEEEIFEGIPVYSLAMRVAGPSLKSKLTAVGTAHLVRRRVTEILRRHQVTMLHVHCVSLNAVYAMAAQRALGLPLVVTLHGELNMDAGGLFQRERWAQRTLRDSLQAAGCVTACSEPTLAEAEAWFGEPLRAKSEVIHNGITPHDGMVAPWPHTHPYILAIGRHVPQKGFDVLLRALGLLEKMDLPKFDLLLAGDGPEHGTLKALAEELGVAKRVHFPGRVAHHEALQMFAGSLFFVLPSRQEPFGLVNLEAMTSNRAVVASRVGGVPEIVLDKQSGLLVPPEDPEALANAIAQLITNVPLRRRLGAAGLERAKDFTWARAVDRYFGVYERVLGETLRSPSLLRNKPRSWPTNDRELARST